MVHGLDAHVLTVDANVLNKVDTGNLDNLYSMWTVFSKCADSVEQGRRLENLSWRLWQREQFCCESSDKPESSVPPQTSGTPPHRSIRLASRIVDDVPHLSSSVESEADDAVEFSSNSLPHDFPRPLICRQDSSASSRSRRERRITADDFEKMVSSIINSKEPLTASENARPTAHQSAPVALPAPAARVTVTAIITTKSNNNKNKSEDMRRVTDDRAVTHTESSINLSDPHITHRTQIILGFSPSRNSATVLPAPPTSQTVSSIIAEIPAPDAIPAATNVSPQKLHTTNFALGGSCSSSEPGSIRRSSKPASLLSAMRSKQEACVDNGVLAPTYDVADEAAVDSDSDDDLDESAIEDDGSSDWEDSVEETGKSSLDETIFKRDNSKVHLPSRPSLITLMIEKSDHARGIVSHSTSALSHMRSHNGPRAPSSSSMQESDDNGLVMRPGGTAQPLRPIAETTAGVKAQPIAAPHHRFASGCLSPRTTRNHMVQSELTASLRVGIVHARKQNGIGLQRRHTSTEVATLRQFPDKACLKQEEDANAAMFARDFLRNTSNGYHDRGW